MRKVVAIFILSLSMCYANNKDDIVEVLKWVETNNNPKAVGDGGLAYGVLQIHKICVDDVNRFYNTHYRHEDAFDVICSEEIFNLYIGMLFHRFQTKHNRDPTEQEIVRSWNGGIYKGYRNPNTLGYYKRYLKWRNILRNKKEIVNL